MNCIVDLTRGTLTNQNMLFSKQDWADLKTKFPPALINEEIENARAKLKKGGKVFKETHDTKKCYWDAKLYQKKASRAKEELGYELISILLDKMLKHGSIFSVSLPTPSEADVMIKVWSDLFEALFASTDIYVRWGEKGLKLDDNSRTIFKLDAKLVLIYDGEEYPISSIEFAPYAGPMKIKTDRSKLLVEGKVLCNKITSLNISEEDADNLNIVNLQIMGLEAHAVTVNLVDDELYTGNTLKSFTLPSTASDLSKSYKKCINNLLDVKTFTLKTAEIIKQTLTNKKKSKKSMKRKLKESSDDDEPGPSKLRISPSWRHTDKA